MSRTSDLSQFSVQIDELIHRLETIANPGLRDDILALVRALMTLHQQGLSAMVGIISAQGDPDGRLLGSLIADPMVEGLLLLHDLHPQDVQTRTRRAIERTANSLHVTGVLLGVEDGVARVRLSGSFHGCGSAGTEAAKLFEAAICDAVPEVAAVEVDASLLNAGHSQPLVQLDIGHISAPRA